MQREKNQKLIKGHNIIESEKQIWPSDRIVKGGLFHTTKTEYCNERADLIRLLLKESKMSIEMHKNVNRYIHESKALDLFNSESLNTIINLDKRIDQMIKRIHITKQKPLRTTFANDVSGSVHHLTIPNHTILSNKEKKNHEVASFNINISEVKLKSKCNKKNNGKNIIDDLMIQIVEKADWLSEMEKLGKGKRYRQEINDQIKEQLRHIKCIETKDKLRRAGIRFFK